MEVFLRVIADTEETILKEVRIKGSATMRSLHEQLFTCFGLESGEMGSFFYSTSTWDQGEELPMFAMDDNGSSMETITVSDFFKATSHGLYVYNFLDMNIFYIEKTKEDEEEGFEDFVILSSVGELPKKKPTETTQATADPSEMSEAELTALYGLDDLDSGALPEKSEDDTQSEEDYYE